MIALRQLYLLGGRCSRGVFTQRPPPAGVAVPQRWSSSDTLPQDQPPPTPDPHVLAQPDLEGLFQDIRKELEGGPRELEEISSYYFDGAGKLVRPVITVLVARAVNRHVSRRHRLGQDQLQVAQVTEMIHTASLLHDDVLDGAHTRRGRASVTARFGHRKSVLAGDYILAAASGMLARLDCPPVTLLLAQVLEDLVEGELMQLGGRGEQEGGRFPHYLSKTFKKTASLMAHSCQAVAVLGGAGAPLQEACYQYGRCVGVAFQLVDDLLDLAASASVAGKPTSVDLRLGLATAPVLFAAQQHPELEALVRRRFSSPGDVATALEYVRRSDGLRRTRALATDHCLRAIAALQDLAPSEEKGALVALTDSIVNRIR